MILRNDILENKNEIIKMVANNDSKAMISRFLLCKPETLDRYLKIFGINYKGNRGMQGRRVGLHEKTAIEYAKQKWVSTHKLRLKLIKDGIKKNECESCDLSEWMGVSIPLELHHIDGNKRNNNFENLKILCPNCHALTPNHAGKKLKKKKEDRAKNKRIKLCKCGKTIKKTSKNCRECSYRKKRKILVRPDINTLIKLVDEIGYIATGRKYGITDNTIRKWINKGPVMELADNIDLESMANKVA